MSDVALAVGTVCGRRGRTKPDCRHLGLIVNKCLHPERIDGRVINRLAGIVLIHDSGQSQLLQIAEALDLMGFLFGLAQGGQEQAGQDRNNGDHDQQFNQSKAQPPGCRTAPIISNFESLHDLLCYAFWNGTRKARLPLFVKAHGNAPINGGESSTIIRFSVLFGSIQSLFPPLPPVQKSQRGALMPNIQLKRAGRTSKEKQKGANRGRLEHLVRCSWS